MGKIYEDVVTFHILMPFSRWFNLIDIGACLRPQGVHLHLLMIKGEQDVPKLGGWIDTYHFDAPPEGFFVGHWLVNQFLENAEVFNEDRYQVLTDDDLVEDGFYSKLASFDDDVLVTSMQRSNIPSDGGAACGFGTLVASPENMKVGHCGFEQILAKGKVLKEYRCGSRYEADGDLIEKMWADGMERFRFVPNAFVYFDRLPPGAYKCNRWVR